MISQAMALDQCHMLTFILGIGFALLSLSFFALSLDICAHENGFGPSPD